MPPKAEIEEWLLKADQDWRTFLLILDNNRDLPTPALFHLQQAVEKWLKAVCLRQGKPVARTHDLGRLMTVAAVKFPDPLHLTCLELNVFAVETRYPGDLFPISDADLNRFLEHGRKIRDQLLAHFG